MSSDLYAVCQHYDYTNQFRNLFALDRYDTIIIYCIVPISSICILLNLYFFCRFPNAREPPFDILLFVTIFSILNIAVYLATNIYNISYPPSRTNPTFVPDSFNSFCLSTGTIHFIAEIGATVYNTVFCFYYTCKIKNPLKSWSRESKQVHGLCIVIIALITIVVYITNQIGVSVLGICGLKVAKSSVFIELSIFIMYFLILAVTSIFFLRYLRKISKHDLRARSFFKYFLLYTFLLSFIYLLNCVVMVLLIIDCYTGMSQRSYSIFAKCGNVIILIAPIIITIIICFHPQFGKKFIPETLKLFYKQKKQKQKDAFYDNLLPIQKTKSEPNSFMIELEDLNSNKTGYLSDAKQLNRLSLLSTILGCISFMSFQRKNRFSMINRTTIGSTEEDHIFSWNFTDEYQIIVDQEAIRQSKEHFVERVPAISIKFISYSVSVFQSLMDRDGVDFLQQSTNPNNNIDKIYQNAQADGGSSGQFFFFTHNNKILLKTITEKQLTVLLERLEPYYHFFMNNPQSLIVKIYGVFTAINPQTQEKLHFMMMGNLCEDINKKYVMRIYDCKGSTHKRQVFKQGKQFQQPDYSRKTMKDVDFLRIQNKIWVDQNASQHLKKVLKTDSFFFLENGLIDYSLIIIKIDYNAYCLDNGDGNGKITFNNRTMYRSNKQPNIIYIFGIIDYLETWNMKKIGERFYKSLFTKKNTISSQSPDYYSKRFCENLIQKIFM